MMGIDDNTSTTMMFLRAAKERSRRLADRMWRATRDQRSEITWSAALAVVWRLVRLTRRIFAPVLQFLSPVLRIFAGIFLLFAVIAATADWSTSHGRRFLSLADYLVDLSPQALAGLRKGLEPIPFVWDPVLATFMNLPAWLSLAVAAALFGWIGRRRHRVNIFIN